jgi:hypothetical protein
MGYVIAGGVLGFVAAATGWAAFDLHWLAAMALWAAGGPIGALAAVAAALARPRRGRMPSAIVSTRTA